MLKSEMTEEEIQLTLKLHQYISSNDATGAGALIQNLCRKTRRKLTRANYKYGIKPALFVAIEQRNIGMVEFLVNECNADVKKQHWTMTTTDPECSVETSLLEVAFNRSTYVIFEFLLTSGADPTRLLQDKSIIVRVCWMGRVSFNALQILADHGADFNASYKGDTCLTRCLQYVDHCRFLLDRGVNINFRSNTGNMALHLAVELGYFDTVKLLLEKGADMYSKNNKGYDPLHLACINGREDIMNMFLARVKDRNRHIESYQLLGTCFFEKHLIHLEGSDDMKAMSAWRKAIAMSSRNKTPPAKLTTPVGILVEVTSFSELNNFMSDVGLAYLQSIVLGHKIFGPSHDRVFSLITSSAMWYFRTGLFDEWMQLLIYCFRMICDSSLTSSERCSQFQTLLFGIDGNIRDILKRHVTLNFSLVYEFLEMAVEVLPKCTDIEEKKTAGDLIFTAILMVYLTKCENHQKLKFQRLVRSSVIVIGQQCERAVLIAAIRRWRKYGWRIDTFPSLAVVTMLLACGADINDRDQDNNNVVHFLLEKETHIKTNFSHLREIATKCVDYGVHLDARNSRGMTTSECLQELGIRIMPPINLMCLAARVIRQHGIVVLPGHLAKPLIDFVEMH